MAIKTYTPEIIEDDSLERLSKEFKEQELKHKYDAKRNQDIVKIQRIRSTKEDKFEHALNTLIAWFEEDKRSIPYAQFNFYEGEQIIFQNFLKKLVKAKCFQKYGLNPYLSQDNLTYFFVDPNVENLYSYKTSQQLITFPNNQTILYRDQTLFFKTNGISPLTIDFSKGKILRSILETFVELKKTTLKDIFTTTEVLNKYKELFRDEITKQYLSQQISNIRNKKIKPLLKERFDIRPAEKNSWILILS